MKRLARGKTTAYQKKQKTTKKDPIWVGLFLDHTEWKGKILAGVLIRVPEDVVEMER